MLNFNSVLPKKRRKQWERVFSKHHPVGKNQDQLLATKFELKYNLRKRKSIVKGNSQQP